MPVDLLQWHVWVLFGLAAGFSSSLLGIGGGVVLMPLLLMVAKFDQDHARGTALAYMIVTCLVGALAYNMRESVHLSLWVIALLTAGGVIGAICGWGVGHRIPLVWVKRMFALLLLFAAVKMFWGTVGGEGGAPAEPDSVTEVTSAEAR